MWIHLLTKDTDRCAFRFEGISRFLCFSEFVVVRHTKSIQV